MPLKRTFIQITEQTNGTESTIFINIRHIESVSVRVDGMIYIRMITGHTYLTNEHVHELLERIQCE